MFDFGWSELLLIAMIAVFVVGPSDVPKIMYAAGRFVRRLQYIRFAFSQQMDSLMQSHDLEELRRGVNFEEPKQDIHDTTDKK